MSFDLKRFGKEKFMAPEGDEIIKDSQFPRRLVVSATGGLPFL